MRDSFLLKIDTSKDTTQNPNNFTVRYNHFELDPLEQYEIALVKSNMWYSWYNISSAIGNNQVKYYNPVDSVELTITFPDGFYSVADINDRFETVLGSNIKVVPNFQTFRVQVQLASGWELRLSNNAGFASLLGFGAVDITTTTTATLPADITRGITSILISCDIVEPNSKENDLETNLLFSFAPDTAPGSLLTFEPKERLYLPLRTHTDHIYSMTTTVKDNKGRIVEFNGENLTHILHIRKKE